MAEAQFTDILITGNSVAKPPRKEINNKDGIDRYIVTFSLSSYVKSFWIETFNRMWAETSQQIPAIPPPLVRDDLLQVTCPLDDQLQGHLDDLKRVVATANQGYREQLQAADYEKRNQDAILQMLRF